MCTACSLVDRERSSPAAHPPPPPPPSPRTFQSTSASVSTIGVHATPFTSVPLPPPPSSPLVAKSTPSFFASVLLHLRVPRARACIGIRGRPLGVQPRVSISAREGGGSRSNSFHFFVTAISRSFLVCMPQRTEYYGTMVKLLVHALHSLLFFVLLSFAASSVPLHERFYQVAAVVSGFFLFARWKLCFFPSFVIFPFFPFFSWFFVCLISFSAFVSFFFSFRRVIRNSGIGVVWRQV